MSKIPINFTGVRVTALIELYARWLDSKEKHPILGDPWAKDVVQRLDFDFNQLESMTAARFAVGVRSRVMDQWVTQFLAANPDAVVLDLGCGVDSRVFRLDLGPGHHWYDVDFPDVIALADQLYPHREGHSTIGGSVTDQEWLARIPTDRPVIVVADGLFGFLTEDQVRDLLKRVVDHFPRGEIVFNTYSSLVKRQRDKKPGPVFGKFGISIGWTLDDEHALEKLDNRLRYVEERSQVQSPLLARTPLSYRMLCAVLSLIPAAKYSTRILRYRF
jgi:O-methyltransferase involved in polyketide biosynthesis